ncbi:PspC domain-containing protein [Weissella coleopterorum]|uniref:PspC domain-containing protein n=1 Tax=Weissella coleopterorum TaxID=2714949 RepID=A0A6G8AZF7_9LACO|nr:PspC domain-containing protein [Weissella coleopterorum]QIL50345.1 PspC domain-containing protein [Weissella coleopterorum]
MKQKIYRSKQDKVLAGLLGGLAEYFGWNSQILRIIYLLLVIFTGFFPFGILYLLLLLVIPESPYQN